MEALRTFLEREGETLGGVNATVEELRADPTIAVGGDGARRTTYELASTKGVRDVSGGIGLERDACIVRWARKWRSETRSGRYDGRN